MTVTIKAKALEAFVADIFASAGCSTDEGGRIGHYLVSANLSGHDSHGVVRVPRYAAQKKNGTVVADVTVDILVDTPVIAVVDGKYGFGQTVTPQAVQIGIDKCRRNGLSAVTLRNAGHVGRVGDWAEMAAEAGLVSIHFVNASGSVLVAPYGGVQRRFSTAPYCVGVPRPGHDPLVLDFATSVVAEGKVLVASQGGKKVPEGALIGPDGKPSSDPHLLYGDYTPTGPRDHSKGTGAIQAFGDHKGSGLAFMCEILGGALSGTGTTDPQRGRFATVASRVPMLDPDPLPVGEGMRGPRHVPGCEDPRRRRPGCIDEHAIVNLQSRRGRELLARPDADAGHDQLGRQRLLPDPG